MKIKNEIIEKILIQLSGTEPLTKDGAIVTHDNNIVMIPVGLFNFPQDPKNGMKGKLVRSFKNLLKELSYHWANVCKEHDELVATVSDEEKLQQELKDLYQESIVLTAYEAIPYSWLDDINMHPSIDTDFLIRIGILFDDTVKMTSSVEKSGNIKEESPLIAE